MSASRIRRLLPRFSLRTLVIFLLLVTAGMGLWWHWEAWCRMRSFHVTRSLSGRHEPSVRHTPAEEGGSAENGQVPGSPDSFRAHNIGYIMQDSQLEAVCFDRVEDLHDASDDSVFSYRTRVFSARTGKQVDSRSGQVRKADLLTVWNVQVDSADGREAQSDCYEVDKFMVYTYGPRERAPLAGVGPFRFCPDSVEDAFAFSSTGTSLAVVEGGDTVHIYLRRRPEWWWGVFWLWEFWLTAAFAALLIWSLLRDRRRFAAAPVARL